VIVARSIASPFLKSPHVDSGIRPSTFPPGAKVTIRLRPMLNGAPAGGFVGAKFEDGKTVGRWE